MESKTREITGPIDLEATLETAQTFCWRRTGDEPLEYTTVVDGEGLRVRETDAGVRFETTGLPRQWVESLLGLDDPLDEIHRKLEHDQRAAEAIDRYGGMRVVSDPFFRCLASFIISANNNVDRIYRSVQELSRRIGTEVEGYGHGFPAPDDVVEAGEERLRNIGLGYRAPYVVESARMIAEDEFDAERVQELPYEEAHEEIQRLHGVGPKVGDCVLLFSLNYTEAVPIDTWMQRAIEDHYPELVGSNYEETAENFRRRFGGYAGYAQNYLFHLVRVEEEAAKPYPEI